MLIYLLFNLYNCWFNAYINIGKICEWHKNEIANETMGPMISALALTLEDKVAKVVSQGCFAFHAISEACVDERNSQSNIISNFMPIILQKLFLVTNREDWQDENLRVGE